MQKIAMQEYCVHCGQEQYKPAVLDISHGKHPCCWCGKMSKEMTEDEYYAKLRKIREATNA
jgi:hypothetical protein